VELRFRARESAWREQIQSPVESGMQKPMKPTLISRAGVEVLVTRDAKVLLREGFTRLESRAEVLCGGVV
jgi:hypothetical protein